MPVGIEYYMTPRQKYAPAIYVAHSPAEVDETVNAIKNSGGKVLDIIEDFPENGHDDKWLSEIDENDLGK